MASSFFPYLNSGNFSFHLIILCVFFARTICQDFDTLIPPRTDVPCHHMTGFYVKRAMDLIRACHKEESTVEVDPKGIRKRTSMPPINCVLKCVGVKLGLLSNEGQPDPAKTMLFVEDVIPKQFQDLAHNVLSECFVEAYDLDNTDPNCASYARVFSCIAAAAKRLRKVCYGW